jgi:hypothetical protein
MPDFGIFRGFNEKLFGDKLYAGQLPINLGVIGSDDFGFDADATAFFTRVTTAGGTLSATEQLAIDTLVKQMKLDGIWTKMKAIYPMVGASAAACSQNLKSSSFTGVFNGGWVFSSFGILGNGSNTFFDTNFNPNTNFTFSTFSYGGYTDTNISGNGYHGAKPPDYLMHSFQSFNRTEAFYVTGSDSYNIGTSGNSGIVGFAMSNLNQGSHKIIANGIVVTTITASTPTSLPDKNMYIGQANGFSGVDNKRISFYYYSDGLTDTEASDLYDAVQTMNTSLSRQV